MNKIKMGWMFSMALFFSSFVSAQNLEEGKKYFYYEKYISAKGVFEKLINANPANAEAAYWLGQSYIGLEDIPGAKTIYQKTLLANNNNPLLLAGMGHVELLEGKTSEARNHFEVALSLSQSKNAAVLNAVGFANINPASQNGDNAYAVEKLKAAIAIKGMKDPDVLCNLGDALKKIGEGGSAQTAYEAALTFDPKYARAKYRIGKIYQTQGAGQEDIYMRYYNETIAMDPTYPPVYENLYQFFYKTNVTKSAEYLEKYLNAKGTDEVNSCYLRASMKFAQSLYTNTLSEISNCINNTPTPYPNLYGLQGYAYSKLNDSVNAKASFENYFKKQTPEKIGAGDFGTFAGILLKFPGNEALAGTYIDKAVQLDKDEASKVTYLKTMAAYFETQKKYKEAADWYNKVLTVKKNISNKDLYNAGYNYYRASFYQEAITVFNLYIQKYPDDIFPYYLIAKANNSIDSTMSEGLANPFYEKVIAIGSTDSVKYKTQLISSYKYFVFYYISIKKDKATALSYCDKILVLDPADAETLSNKSIIPGMNLNAPKPTKPAQAATGTKPPAKKN